MVGSFVFWGAFLLDLPVSEKQKEKGVQISKKKTVKSDAVWRLWKGGRKQAQIGICRGSNLHGALSTEKRYVLSLHYLRCWLYHLNVRVVFRENGDDVR